MRLNAFLAKAGVASRRGADELIKAGRVTVNGRAGRLNDDVTDNDEIKVDNHLTKLQQYRTILLYKPAGYITTMRDPKGRRKVTDLVRVSERVVPVGRLDYDTTGALLLTNDGEMAHRLTHPSFGVDKVYEAEVKGNITDGILHVLSTGVKLQDGKAAPAKARKISDTKVELIIHEGRKHQVKRMLGTAGLPVAKLHRSGYAFLNLAGLRPGKWRDLTKEEVQKLQQLVYS